jgi:hypothetical protein
MITLSPNQRLSNGYLNAMFAMQCLMGQYFKMLKIARLLILQELQYFALFAIPEK